MAFIIAERVKDSTTTTGTGALTLANSAPTGYRTFGSQLTTGDSTFYAITSAGGAEWEVGVGTYTVSGTSLSRDSVLASSNAGALVNLSSGTKDVFVTIPAYTVRTLGQDLAIARARALN